MAAKIGGRQGLAATLLVLVGIVVVDLHGMGRDRCGSCHDGGLPKSLNRKATVHALDIAM